jgi:EmrB/QacA subfamily drug resistance transporter
MPASETSAVRSEGVSVQTGRWVLFATILASSMAFIDSSALNVALPALQADLHARGTELLWIVNAYALILAALLLVGGSLGDRFGRKRVFMIGIALFAGASLVCGLASSTGMLIGARAAQGIGAALMVPGSLAIISASFGPGRRGRAIGTWSSFTTITTVIGPALGGFLASVGLWRAVFFINIPLALAALVALYLKVPESRDETAPARLDYAGAALATIGLAGITYGFTEVSEQGLRAPPVLLALIGGVLALIAFVFVEARSDHPMVRLQLFRSRTFSGTNLMTLFLYAALYGMLFFFPLNLIQVQGYGALAGFAALPSSLMLAVLSRWAGGLVDRFGPRLPLTIGPLIAGAGFLLFALPGLTSGPRDYWTSYFPASLVLGLGMAITVAPLTTAVMGSVSPHRAGVASGINNAVSRAAGVLAIAAFGAVALFAFGAALETRTSQLDLPVAARAAIHAEAANLGNAHPPAGLSAEASAAVELAIKQSFVDMFRLLAAIAAGLAWLSALLAALTVESRLGAPVDEIDLRTAPAGSPDAGRE